MKKRIRAMAAGKYDYRPFQIQTVPERIELMVTKNKVSKGSFWIRNKDERKLTGIVYTEDSRMKCETVQFHGRKVQIQYAYYSQGMEEGETKKGELCIVCNGGEWKIPYVVSVTHSNVSTSIGKIQNLYQFARLAKTNYSEAYRLFCSGNFQTLLASDKQRHLFEALTQYNVCKEHLEEFLVAVGRKEPIRFILHSSEEVYECEGESFMKKISISKNTWGYVVIKIESDADFIHFEKSTITSEDFIGNHYDWEFIVEKNKMHTGMNCARIQFISGNQRESVKIEIGLAGNLKKENIESKKLIAQLGRLYIQMRCGKIKKSYWIQQSMDRIEHLNGLHPEDPGYMLFRSYIYIQANKRKEAEWMFQKLKGMTLEKNPDLYGYYLYVQALLEKDESARDQIIGEIRKISQMYSQNFPFFQARLLLDQELAKNNLLKFRLLKDQYHYGNRSPWLFLEAALLLYEDSSLLIRLEEFEQNVLAFANRNELLDEQIVEKTAYLVSRMHEFSEVVFQVLVSGYEMYESKECLETICGILIRTNQRSSRYFPWFERGVNAGLNLTLLYEYYLYTVPEKEEKMFPKVLFMYFNFDNQLDYKRKAMLYANFWKYRNYMDTLFYSYEARIKLFVIEQIKKKHINENLSYLYEELLDYILEQETIWEEWQELLFVQKLTCSQDMVRHVVVRHEELDYEELYPVVDGVAWIKKYYDDAILLLEDRDGKRHEETLSYTLENMISEKNRGKSIARMDNTKTGILLYLYHNKEQDNRLWEKLMLKKRLRQSFRQILLQKLSVYYIEEKDFAQAETVMSQLDINALSPKQRIFFQEKMIERGFYEKAYQLTNQYGAHGISSLCLIKLCNAMIEREKEEETLLEICWEAFEQRKYNENILQYLLKYYYGPTQQMIEVWKAAREFQIEEYTFLERILLQMIFCGNYPKEHVAVFTEYYKSGGSSLLIRSYLSHFAYKYVVEEEIIDERLIEYMVFECERDEQLSPDCARAILKYYSNKKSIETSVVPVLDKLIEKTLEEKQLLPWLYQLPSKWTEDRLLCIPEWIQYKAEPGKRIFIRYRILFEGRKEQEYIREELEEIYPLHFCKAMLLFQGEICQYYLIEQDIQTEEERIVESRTIKGEPVTEIEHGRWSYLNKIVAGENKKQNIKQYKKLNKVVDTMFSLKE